ncbi:MAG: hypothetical protein GXP54_05860 [Deltaproteobacteria bacterium]|nr:hypothetical protein [Deltaproteobacteria bacterium]
MRSISVAIILSGALHLSCAIGGGGERAPGYGTTRTFDVDYSDPVAPVKAFNGLDGGPPSASAVGSGWALNYQQHGMGLARTPRGSGCGFTLDAVCPNPAESADIEPLCAYGFNTLDRQVSDLFQLGMLVVWQAMFDVGAGACEPRDGIEVATRTVMDPEVWPVVVSRVLGHLRTLGRLPQYVEFLPDATGIGGYGANQTFQVMNLYDAFIERLRQDFPDDDKGKRAFSVLAPSFAVRGLDDLTDPKASVGAFIDHVSTRPGRQPDIVSLITTAPTPDGRLELWRAARDSLDGAGMASVGLAEMGPLIDETVWSSLSDRLDTRKARSAFYAARLTAAGILGQDVLDMMVADRRSGPRSSAQAVAGEDLFFGEDGAALPALSAAMPWYLMNSRHAVRLGARLRGSDGPSDGEGMVVMGAKAGDSEVMLLIAASGANKVGDVMTFQIELEGLPAWAVSAQLSRAVVDRNTSAFAFIEKEDVEVRDGALFISREVGVPSINYLDLILKEADMAGADAFVKDTDTAGE